MIDYQEFRKEIDVVISELLKLYIKVEDIDEHIEKNYPTYIIQDALKRFSVELDATSKNTISIRTYYLSRDKDVFNQYKKIEVPHTRINMISDNDGQVMVEHKNTEYLPDVFRQSHIKKHFYEVTNFQLG